MHQGVQRVLLHVTARAVLRRMTTPAAVLIGLRQLSVTEPPGMVMVIGFDGPKIGMAEQTLIPELSFHLDLPKVALMAGPGLRLQEFLLDGPSHGSLCLALDREAVAVRTGNTHFFEVSGVARVREKLFDRLHEPGATHRIGRRL